MAPNPPDEYDVAGLENDVEILVDTWGVPHLYAQSTNDVFLAQGFNAARDRLFQIDLWRRRGNGLLAEVFGPAYVEQDRANRLFLYRGDMDAEWAAYAEGTREAVAAFARGVNAYVAWVRENPAHLPPEFALYGYVPSFWAPEDAVRFRTHGLFYNAEQEVARARTLRDAGREAEELRQAREPADRLAVPAGVDLDLISDDILRVYRLAFAPVDFHGAADPASARESISGSNNWVVSGERTDTGRPILANDPHRAITLPSLRYVAHLDAPGMSVIGAGEPGLPGISIGHNGHVAFGLTIWPVDHEDLYLYELNPDDESSYRYGDGWEPFRVIEEMIPVGADEVPVALVYTRHGPVIYSDPARGFAVAVRAAWLEPGMAPYLASIGYDAATNGSEFLDALQSWGAPGVNQVFATPEGDWGWQASAKVPRRPNWDGSLPVTGDGRYEWDGFVSAPGLPSMRRDPRGWFASANEMNLPDDFDNTDLTTTYDWYSGGRSERLTEWLEHHTDVSLDESLAMQSDAQSPHALRLLRALQRIDPDAIANGEELSALLAWDGVESADSRAALVFEIWVRRHLRPWMIDRVMTAEGLSPEQARAARAHVMKDESFGGDLRGDIRMIERLARELEADDLAQGVASTLDDALADIAELLGPEEAGGWTWGRLHHSAIAHAAFAAADGVDPMWRGVGPRPRGGSGDTVGMAGYDAQFRQSIGSTFRMVIDVGEWDNSRALNSPGQSGDPRSPHYRDLFDPWVDGESFPLAYSRASVEAMTQSRILLRAPIRASHAPG
ncbi:penicillin acylase family protein [Microbacterium rhizomatis]|uniref:Penicillin acylase family protein n=1 Tax=Microbacterium rhizomatis TaxID=1631477 RepID=A0A5J5IXD1_9MICO|nr:penicillin acylase family protein [Microbacterium rhizomatis]KAA9105538.1 penicillin acylase family protein [Microbacterium rhizomatis]